jgi:S-adenosylmethionine-diacylglycerol 3-amino-3-carboxypropyl transferase
VSTAPLSERVRFDHVRYANCWEDADVLCEALAAGPGSRVLSIASAGDNVLALAADGADVVAVDLSQAQIACLELRRAAFRRLDHAGVLSFLGVTPAGDRAEVYRALREDLPPEARAVWDGRLHDVERGVIHAGRLERFFRLMRTRVLPLVHSRATVEELLREKDDEARRAFYARRWDSWRWRAMFRIFFSRTVVGRVARDPEFFRFVSGPVSARILDRARQALTARDVHRNPFLEYMLTGVFARARPRYLEGGRFDAVRAGVERIRVHRGPVEEAARAAGGRFDAFNLSDIFEYMDPSDHERVYAALLETARPGARFAYWNLLVPRRRPSSLAERVRSLAAQAEALSSRDRAFFFSAFVLEEAG